MPRRTLRIRKPRFYPLNYGDLIPNPILDLRLPIAKPEQSRNSQRFVMPRIGLDARAHYLRYSHRLARLPAMPAAKSLTVSTEFQKEIELEIAHVLFLDIVGYSKLSLNERQARIQFNVTLRP